MMCKIDNEIKNNVVNFLKDKNKVLDSVVYGVCPKDSYGTDIIKVPYLDLEVHFRIIVDDETSIVVSHSILDITELRKDYETLMACAEKNTRAKLKITTLGEILGLPDMTYPPITVIANESNYNGASGILFEDIFKELCEKYGREKCYILPSSIHELLVYFPNDGDNKETFDAMVREVNKNEVRPEDRLADHAYRYDLETNAIIY